MSKLIADVSKHQGICNFEKMKKAGVTAVIIRAGYRSASSGTLTTDSKYAENIKKALAAGLPVGVYWWTQAKSIKEAEAEADYCVKLIGKNKLSFPAWLDLEYYTGRKGRADKLSAKVRTTYALAFLKRCEKLGFKAGVYCNPDFWRSALEPSRLKTYPRWIAHYGKSAGLENDIWQYTSTAKGAPYGVSSAYIDLSHMYTDFPAGKKTKFAPDHIGEATKMISATGNPYQETAKTVTSKERAEKKGIKDYVSSGEGVKHIQYELKRLGYDLGSAGIDGDCRAKTVAAIEKFQAAKKLTVDGLAGPATRAALKATPTPTAKATVKKDHIVTAKATKDTLAPNSVTIDGNTSPVWAQGKWVGAHKERIHANGCGYCCTAVAARLRGKKDATPGTVFSKALKTWGAPKNGEHYYISCNGIIALLKSYGVKASYVRVTKAELPDVQQKITAALKAGKQVICWCHKYANEANAFTSGNHYVIAVGLNKDGKIIVANSSGGKIQLTTAAELTKALYRGCTGKARTWGTTVQGSAGIVIVG